MEVDPYDELTGWYVPTFDTFVSYLLGEGIATLYFKWELLGVEY